MAATPLDFVLFYVADLEQSLAFYGEQIGFSRVTDQDGTDFRYLTTGAGGPDFGLFQARRHARRRHGRAVFQDLRTGAVAGRLNRAQCRDDADRAPAVRLDLFDQLARRQPADDDDAGAGLICLRLLCDP